MPTVYVVYLFIIGAARQLRMIILRYESNSVFVISHIRLTLDMCRYIPAKLWAHGTNNCILVNRLLTTPCRYFGDVLIHVMMYSQMQ